MTDWPGAPLIRIVRGRSKGAKPRPLDRAVTMVEEVGGPMISAETLDAERLSLLLDALADVQSATRKAVPLAIVARICADWVQANEEDEEAAAIGQMRSRVRSMPEVIGTAPARFLVLAGIIGKVASMLGDYQPSVAGELIDAGACALAWAARIIEEEEEEEGTSERLDSLDPDRAAATEVRTIDDYLARNRERIH